MIDKAFDVSADGIIFDLEDAVSWQEKDQARQNVRDAILRAGNTDKEILVRINAVSLYCGIKDLLEVIPVRPNTLIIPKADDKSLVTADMMIGAMEEHFGWEPNTIQIIPLVETTYSIVNAKRVLSSTKRISGVQLGAEDLAKELEIARTKAGDELQYARSTLVFVGRTLGLDIIDTPFTDFRDKEGLVTETQKVKAMGMTGKVCIHPNQIEPINSIFTPAAEEIEYARRVAEAFANAVAEGKGACSLDGKMIDVPIAEKAQKIIRKAKLMGMMPIGGKK
jgi:citrate lyase subunit beta/citryl-CoA lyase